MLGDSLYLENIQEYVHDEEKIVRELFFCAMVVPVYMTIALQLDQV